MDGELGEKASPSMDGLVCFGVLLGPLVLSSGRRRTGEWKGFRRVTFAASTRRRLLAAGVDMAADLRSVGDDSRHSFCGRGSHGLVGRLIVS